MNNKTLTKAEKQRLQAAINVVDSPIFSTDVKSPQKGDFFVLEHDVKEMHF